ncbi:hypothetical protein BofuT4_uP162120.1 [Botrytis cinerea T4]|uniref:Uncharacterized protein n=1 Tax=Botryotinia fuckeliana (strain T4) TaxID=999810 RepID=G2YT19_BOTF4|nr:hypothetical protein BofuT4_uP162120.1 [Botrytis cinerea T4]
MFTVFVCTSKTSTASTAFAASTASTAFAASSQSKLVRSGQSGGIPTYPGRAKHSIDPQPPLNATLLQPHTLSIIW